METCTQKVNQHRGLTQVVVVVVAVVVVVGGGVVVEVF